MFCYQCQETAGCTGCTRAGVCGKSARTAALQDLLVYVTRGLCQLTTALRNQGEAIIPEDDRLVTENLFVTITNANFDDDALQARIRATLERNAALRSRLDGAGLSAAARWDGSGDWDDKAQAVGVLSTADEDIRSLRELITYGLKGMAAYNHHVNAYGKSAPGVDAFLQAALAKTLDDSLTAEELTALALETGKYGVDVMAALDEANTSAYGHPEVTRVNLGVRDNPAILVSGHDLHDLKLLLEQTEGKGLSEVSQLCGQLRQRLVAAEGGVRGLPRPHPADHQLSGAPEGQLQEPALYHRGSGLSRLPPHRGRPPGTQGFFRPDRPRQALPLPH